MKSSKSLLTLLSCLAFFIAVLLFPMVTKAAPATSIVVDGVPVADNTNVFGEQTATATFDSQNGILYLNGTQFTSIQSNLLYANGDLKIVCTNNPVLTQNSDYTTIRLDGTGTLEIEGDLTIISNASSGQALATTGDIIVNGNVNFLSSNPAGNLNPAVTSDNNVNMNGNLIIDGFNIGIAAHDITISGNVNIDCNYIGITAGNNITILNSTNSSITSHTNCALTTYNTSQGTGPFGGDIIINGTLDVSNNSAPTINSYGKVDLNGNIRVTNTSGSQAINANGDITILSGTIEAHNASGAPVITTSTTATNNGTIIIPASHEISFPTDAKIDSSGDLILLGDGSLAHDVIISPKNFTITVTNDGNGTASAPASTGISGDTITLTATPASGYQFKEWQVVSGGVTVTNDSFTIGTSDVEVKAIFELIPVATTYKVTVTNDGNGSASASKSTGATGDSVTLTATPSTGYKFKEWLVVSGGVTVTNDSFTIGSADVEVKAVFEEDATNTNTNTNSGTTNNTTTNSGTNNTSNTTNTNTTNTSNSNSSSNSSSSSNSNSNNAAEVSPAKDSVPKTGENNALPALFILALVSMLGMTAFGLNLKKNN